MVTFTFLIGSTKIRFFVKMLMLMTRKRFVIIKKIKKISHNYVITIIILLKINRETETKNYTHIRCAPKAYSIILLLDGFYNTTHTHTRALLFIKRTPLRRFVEYYIFILPITARVNWKHLYIIIIGFQWIYCKLGTCSSVIIIRTRYAKFVVKSTRFSYSTLYM